MTATVTRTETRYGFEVVADGEVIGYVRKQTEGAPVVAGNLLAGHRAARGYDARPAVAGAATRWFPTQAAAVEYLYNFEG